MILILYSYKTVVSHRKYILLLIILNYLYVSRNVNILPVSKHSIDSDLKRSSSTRDVVVVDQSAIQNLLLSPGATIPSHYFVSPKFYLTTISIGHFSFLPIFVLVSWILSVDFVISIRESGYSKNEEKSRRKWIEMQTM